MSWKKRRVRVINWRNLIVTNQLTGEIKNRLAAAQKVVIASHVRPDGDAIGSLLDMAAKQLKPETVTSLTETLHQTVLKSFEGTYTTEDFINKFGPEMAHQLLDPVLQAVDPYAAELVAKFSGPFDKLIAYAGDILTVTGVLQSQGEQLKTVFGESVTLQSLEAVKGADESFSGALQRLGSVFEGTNRIAELMGRSQESVWGQIGLASSAARQQLVDFAGGIDKLNAAIGSYYSHYFSAEEQLTHQHDQLATLFDSWGVKMPTTLSGFRSLVEGVDLTTESGRKLYTQLLSVETPFYNYITAIENSGKAAANATSGFTLMHNALNTLPSATQLGSTSLTSFNRAITDTGAVAAAAAAATAASISKINGLLAYWQPGGAGSNVDAGPFLLAQRNSAVGQFQAGRSWAAGMSIDDLVNALTHIDPNDYARYSAGDQALIASILTTQQQIEDYLRQQASNSGSQAQDTGSVQNFAGAVDTASSAVDQLAQQLDRARQSMADWLHSLGVDSRVSPLLPMQQFNQAQNDFVESILHFNRADPNSYASFQATGSAFLNQALTVFPRAGQTYGDIFQFVQSAGQQLLSGQNVAAMLAQLLEEIRTASRQSSIDVRNQTAALEQAQDQSTTKLVAANGNDAKWLQ